MSDATEPQSVPNEQLSLAGAVVDKAVDYMVGQKVEEPAIASALLGGALAMMSRSMADEAIIAVLENAIAAVRSGELNHSHTA